MPTLRRPSRSPSPLRRSLRASTSEGTAAEVVGACCAGAALTGWAIHLGLSATLIGLLGALPVVAQVLQAPAAFLTARFGHRRVALTAIAAARQAFLPIAVLPAAWLAPAGRQALLLGSAAAFHGLGIVCNNAWNAWIGELVPARLRGRYFGRRTAICTVANCACGLAAGLVLERGDRHAAVGATLQALALVGSAAGAVSVAFMARQHARPRREAPPPLAVAALLAPLRDPRARRVTSYNVAWSGACGLSAPFFGLYLLRDLHTGYALLAAQGAGLAAAKVASTAAWGRAVDRHGARRVLVVCTAGLAVSPLAWIACRGGVLWPLWLETAVGGVLLGGHGVASFSLPLEVAPPRQRPFYLAAVAMAGGLAFGATSAFGGALAEAAQAATGASALPYLLAGSAALRLGALRAALRLPERRPVSVRTLPAPAMQRAENSASTAPPAAAAARAA